jgi:hypothetical protein
VRDTRLRERNAGRSLTAWSAGRCRIARTIEYTAALNALRRPHRPGWVNVAAHISIILRIAVDEERGRAVALGLSRLDPTE